MHSAEFGTPSENPGYAPGLREPELSYLPVLLLPS